MCTLTELRQQVDQMDARLVAVLGERVRLCQRIGDVKAQRGVPTWDRQRMKHVRQHVAGLAVQHGVSAELTAQVYKLIMQESCRLQRMIVVAMCQGAPNGDAPKEGDEIGTPDTGRLAHRRSTPIECEVANRHAALSGE